MMSTATAAVNAVVALSVAAAVSQNPSVAADSAMTTRHEHGGDAIGQPLHVGLAGLRRLDEPADLRQCRVGADPRRPDDEPAAGVHRRAGNGVARTDLDGHRLAGQQRGVDR